MSEAPRRRDLLTTVAFATAGVGALAALWPFIDSMNPAADVRARATVFRLNTLEGETPRIIAVGNHPVMLFRRSLQVLSELRASSNQPAKFRDIDSVRSRQPAWAKNWHRSLRPELMVCIANCTREGCVVSRMTWTSEPAEVIRCSCCGATFDLAGRLFEGPAPSNLTVPNYRFIGDDTIEFNEMNLLS